MARERYDFNKVEKTILSFWKNNKIYDKIKSNNAEGENFYFLQGPPYTSNYLHSGQAWNHALKDMMLRYHRMLGKNIWARNGYDMHGLPTARAVMKKFNLVTKDDIEKFGVAKFVQACREHSTELSKSFTNDLIRVGTWLDYEDPYLPVTNEYIEGVWWLVKKAEEKKRLYLGKKVMTWCYDCETACAKHELEYKEVKEESVFLKFKVKGKENEYLIVWTTTPWTIPYNLAVMVNPGLEYVRAKVGDEIWIVAKGLAGAVVQGVAGKSLEITEEFMGDKLEGMEYEHPLQKDMGHVYDKLKKDHPNVCTIILTEDYCDLSAGSGMVHTAPGCGPEDFEACQPYDVPAFNNLKENGYFPKDMGKFSGWHAKKDVEKFLQALKDSGCLIEMTSVEHDYAHCQRCHNPVIFRLTDQWFFKMEDLKPSLVAANKKINWNPQSADNAYDSWLKNLKDNSISKQRYWGTPLPIWICDKCKNYTVVENREELRELAGKVPDDLHKPFIDEITFPCDCGGVKKRVPDIVDVWVDAGSACWSSLYFPMRDDLLKQFWPADVIIEGKDQIRGWFNILLVCSYLGFDEPSFKNVYMHGFITDVEGVKMSKSLDNVISPYEIIDKYGADTFRYYCLPNTAGVDMNFSWEGIKLKYRNLIVLWNLHNYLLDLAEQYMLNPRTLGTLEEERFGVEEKYIISKLNSTIKTVTEYMEKLRYDEVVNIIEDIFFEISRTYVQLVRDKVTFGKEEDRAVVVYCLYKALLETLKMMTIVTPFIAEMMFQNFREAFNLKTESLNMYSWPKYDEKLIDLDLEKQFEVGQSVIKIVLNLREKAKIGRRWPVKEIIVVAKKADTRKAAEAAAEIVKNQANVKEVSVVDHFAKVKESIKADYAKLAPDFKEKTAMIIARLASTSMPAVLDKVKIGGTFRLKLDDGEVDIKEKHLLIEREVPSNYVYADFKGMTIYLDTERTPELDAEGYAREIMRNIQSERKKAGLAKSDQIDLYVQTGLEPMLVKFVDDIALKCGAKGIKIEAKGPSKQYEQKIEFKIKDKAVTVMFNKL
ncbi:MAG: isoleucine--tRNA ligase [Nanoarchaeota archaeon]|nr:isoleucine--tRNA ligase [Nanoarchaeota archaeon]